MVALNDLESLLHLVRDRLKPYPMPEPCPEQEVLSLPDIVAQELNAHLAHRYLDVLRIANGFSYNALIVFASKTFRDPASDIEGRELFIRGIVDANGFYRGNDERYEELLLYCIREGYVYAQVVSTGLFIKLSETEDEPREVYQTFDEMMIAAIRSALGESSLEPQGT